VPSIVAASAPTIQPDDLEVATPDSIGDCAARIEGTLSVVTQ
jgi:hypothetical protein